MHSWDPADEYLPELQLEQVAAPACEKSPEEQGMHMAESLAPVSGKYLPASHGAHSVLPSKDEKNPLVQKAHSVIPLTRAYFPSIQSAHDVELFAPRMYENFPAAQSSQKVAPSMEEYFPASHITHALASNEPSTNPYVPALHGMHNALQLEGLHSKVGDGYDPALHHEMMLGAIVPCQKRIPPPPASAVLPVPNNPCTDTTL
jgi:hypothetical protein